MAIVIIIIITIVIILVVIIILTIIILGHHTLESLAGNVLSHGMKACAAASHGRGGGLCFRSEGASTASVSVLPELWSIQSYVCMYVAFVCMHACMQYVFMYVCMCPCIHICT